MNSTTAVLPPPVALESSVIAQGLPYPVNVDVALKMEAAVKAERARPVTLGIVAGEVVLGLSEDQIRHFGSSGTVDKVSIRDLPVVIARGHDGATTVASTVFLAASRGIEIVATGGIGGVHRGSGVDVSADLTVLAQSNVTVVCSGAKTLLDLVATRERLETNGITVVGFRTEEFPGFYCRQTGLPVDIRCESIDEIARVVRARRGLELPGATLVAVPVPAEVEIPREDLEPVIEAALRSARSEGISAARVTPYVLHHIAEATRGQTLKANVALLENNAVVAGQLAVALSR